MSTASSAEPSFYTSMGEHELQFSSDLFAALGNPTRLKIAELLIKREHTVSEVTQTLGILQPNASQNLGILQRAGIAKVTRRGAQRLYSLRGPRIERMIVLAREFLAIHQENIRREVESVGGRRF